MARILLTNATIVTGASSKKGALAIDGERIAGIWHRGGSDLDDSAAVQAFPGSEIIDLDGKVLMGVVSFMDVAKAVLEEQGFENRMLKNFIKNWPTEDGND